MTRGFLLAASALARLVEMTVGLILGVILILAMGEIVFRYVTDQSLVWVDELSRLLFVWLTFLAAAAAFHHRMHFRVVLLWRGLSARRRRRLEVFVDFVSVCLAVILLVQSLHIIERTRVQQTTALEIPMSYVYSVVPVSACLIVAFIALRWIEAVRTRHLPDPAESAHS